MKNDKLCLVCGYEMEDGPRDFNICPCCGTEYGLHDVNSTIADLRDLWIRGGLKWRSTVVCQPERWTPALQLAALYMQWRGDVHYNSGTVTVEPQPEAQSSLRLKVA